MIVNEADLREANATAGEIARAITHDTLGLLGAYSEALAQREDSSERTDGLPGSLGRGLSRLREAASRRVASSLTDSLVDNFSRQVSRRVAGIAQRAFGVSVDVSGVSATQRVSREAQRELHARTLDLSRHHVSRVGEVMERALGRGTSVADVGRLLQERIASIEEQARMAAQGMLHRLNAGLSAVLFPVLSMDRYVWNTQRDSLVRATHAAQEGQVYLWSDPPAETGHPGEDTSSFLPCRCYPTVTLEDSSTRQDRRMDTAPTPILPAVPQWLAELLLRHPRIAIAGGPKTGKTTLAHWVTDRPVLHTDDYINKVSFEDTPQAINSDLASLSAYLVEGVQVPRMLRKGLTPDVVVWLEKPWQTLTPGQEAMRKGVVKVFTDWVRMGSGVKVVGRGK